MMGLTDRVEPWARRFQRPPERAPEPAETEAPRASLRALEDDDAAPEQRTGRFTRRRVLQEQEG
jgi:hypothetical protein